jgi:hypothetical protein
MVMILLKSRLKTRTHGTFGTKVQESGGEGRGKLFVVGGEGGDGRIGLLFFKII